MATAAAPERSAAEPAEAGCLVFLDAPVFATTAWQEDGQWVIEANELDVIATASTSEEAAVKLGEMILNLWWFLNFEVEAPTEAEAAQRDLIARRLGPLALRLSRGPLRDILVQRLRGFLRRPQWRVAPSTHEGSSPALIA